MAGIYGVTPADIASELPGLFRDGFTATTIPSDTKVTELIETADAIVLLRIDESVGLADVPADEPNAVFAIRYVIEWVKAQVLRIVYAAADATTLAALVSPAETLAESMLELLVTQTVGVWGVGRTKRAS